MAIELAVALSAIATKALVGQLIQGTPMARSDWAAVAGQVIDAFASVLSSREASIDRSGVRTDQFGKKLDQISGKIDAIQLREFEQEMAAGIRHLRDLPRDWRNEQDRHDLIRDARNEFVRAFATAELAGEVQRQALAEVAIAGCWLWVPSLPDVRHTIGEARRLLEDVILSDNDWQRYYPSDLLTSYRDVLALCKSYDEQLSSTAIPIRDAEIPAQARQAALVVRTQVDQWVGCAGIEVKAGSPQVNTETSSKRVPQRPTTQTNASRSRKQRNDGGRISGPARYVETTQASYALSLEVRNTRAEPISVILAEAPSPFPIWTIQPSQESQSDATTVMVTGGEPMYGRPITVLVHVRPKGQKVAFLVSRS